jgi:PAH dioxygenase large subunit
MTALPYLNRPLRDFEGPGDAYRPILSEVTQFRFLQYWNRIMTGDA